MRTGEMVNGKLSLAIGFQIRYASAFVEMVKRVRQGDIGEIINVQLYYFSSGSACRRNSEISYDEDRIRNHFHFNSLSGGILVDQGIHMLDVCNWALNAHPLKAVGTGGKKGGAEFGDIWTNYQVLYEYPDNVNVCFHNTQQGSQFGDVCARFIGSGGLAEAHYSGGVFISGEKPWDSGIVKCGQEELSEAQRSAGVFLSALHDADSNKDAAFIKSIETGNYLNEALQGSESTLTAILGRNAAASGEEITWEELIASNEKLDPMLDLTMFDK
jgi:predicted dehydrogenase